jgi:hypothetical protein
MKVKFIAAALAALTLTTTLAACGSDADVASKNISKEAEQFKVVRRIIVVNGVTDKVELEVVGRCSYEHPAGELQLVCKEAPGAYKKHTIGLSDNVFFAVTQLQSINVSVYRTKIILKPQNIVPDLDLVTGERG